MSNIPQWVDVQHVLMLSLCTVATYTNALAATPEWDDPLYAGFTLPIAPTSFEGPLDLVPVGGAYFGRESIADDAAPTMIPFVNVSLYQTAAKVDETDTECDFYDVPVQIRVRVGIGADEGVSAGTTKQLANARAMSLCKLATNALTQNIAFVALAKAPTHAFGICWVEVMNRPLLDTSAPKPPQSTGVAYIDAVSVVNVRQRLFSSDGIAAAPTPTP